VETALQRFVDTAVAPMGVEGEAALVARRELIERLERAGATGEEVAAARERLDRVDAAGGVERWLKVRRWVISSVMGVIAVVLALLSWHMLLALLALEDVGVVVVGEFDPMPWLSAKEKAEMWEARMSRDLTPEQRDFLLAPVFSADIDRQGRSPALLESRPGDPAILADTMLICSLSEAEMFAEFLDQAREIDPGNAFFVLRAAEAGAHGSVERARRKRRKGPAPPANQWQIKDQEKLAGAMCLFHEAAGMRRFDSYKLDVCRERIALLAAPGDFRAVIDQAIVQSCLPVVGFGSRPLADALAAESERLAGEEDREGLRKLVKSWENVWRLKPGRMSEVGQAARKELQGVLK